jgi:hypothetical protein
MFNIIVELIDGVLSYYMREIPLIILKLLIYF